MASTSWLSYQRLRKLPKDLDFEEEEEEEGQLVASRSWLRLRQRRWRRPRVRVAGLRRLLRRKARVVGFTVRKVLKRLKEGRPYIGELFAGNYMFMQVSPSPTPSTMGCLEKSFLPPPPNSTRINLPRVVS